jgi:hypothetical protein
MPRQAEGEQGMNREKKKKHKQDRVSQALRHLT